MGSHFNVGVEFSHLREAVTVLFYTVTLTTRNETQCKSHFSVTAYTALLLQCEIWLIGSHFNVGKPFQCRKAISMLGSHFNVTLGTHFSVTTQCDILWKNHFNVTYSNTNTLVFHSILKIIIYFITMGSFGFLWNCTSRTRVSFSAGRSLTGSYPLGAPSVTDMPGPSPFVFFRTPSCASSIAFSSQGKYRGKKMRTHKFIHISKLSFRFLRRLRITKVKK